MEGLFLSPLITGLVLPLLRLVGVMAVSLIVAQALETFRWTEYIANLAVPLVRRAHLSALSGASFSLSFASPSAANAVLAEGLVERKIGRRELIIANVMNSTPAFFVHLPTLLAMAWSFLEIHALAYVGLLFFAAALRTLGAVVAGRIMLAAPEEERSLPVPTARIGTFRSMLTRFRKRLTKICLFTIPVYCFIFFLQQAGAFSVMEAWLAAHMGALFFLHPGALGLVILFVAAESNAAFAAAAALIAGGTITPEQAVIALLTGNILSSPMRAFRHQLPSYSGFFSPPTAWLLVSVNQSLRAATLILALAVYCLWVQPL